MEGDISLHLAIASMLVLQSIGPQFFVGAPILQSPILCRCIIFDLVGNGKDVYIFDIIEKWMKALNLEMLLFLFNQMKFERSQDFFIIMRRSEYFKDGTAHNIQETIDRLDRVDTKKMYHNIHLEQINE